jgi:hypothetical protein
LEECKLKLRTKKKDTVLEEIAIRRSTKDSKERISALQLSPDILQKRDYEALEYEVTKPSQVKRTYYRHYGVQGPRDANPVGVLLRHFLPDQVAVIYDAVDAQINLALQILIDDTYLRYAELPSEAIAVLETIREQITPILNQAVAKGMPQETSGNLTAAIESLTKDFSFKSFRRFHAQVTPL